MALVCQDVVVIRHLETEGLVPFSFILSGTFLEVVIQVTACWFSQNRCQKRGLSNGTT